MIEFTIVGPPVPKGRPKFRILFVKNLAHSLAAIVRRGDLGALLSAVRRGITVSTYTPPETVAAEAEFAWKAKKYQPRKPLTGPLHVTTVFVVARPQRLDADRSRDWPHVKPDDDNYRKLVLDALNEMFWHDDGQICGGESYKIYGDTPRTFVRIRQLGPGDALRVRRMLGENRAIEQMDLMGGHP